VQWLAVPWFFRQTGFALCFGWFVWSAGHGFSGWTGRFLSSRPMVFMGKISYGVYVWQGFALFYWYWLLDSSPLPLSRVFTLSGVPQVFYQDEIVAKLMALIITLVAALASYWFLESPIHSLRRHFPYSRKRPAH
jgi:peptidoglycan/LPS O-acetylase OafA/YrhL